LTYELETNARARANAFKGELSRRLDRVLSSRRQVPVAVGLVGQTEPPSDHFGVWADLKVVGP
jgi:endonuclease/exonuclease/phosphatase family metal-dependent hydrolase